MNTTDGDRSWVDDLSVLSEKECARLVTRMCSAYGTVVRVVVHIEQAHRKMRAFALVDMSQAEEAERLAAAFNRSRIGSTVLLLLRPQVAS